MIKGLCTIPAGPILHTPPDVLGPKGRPDCVKNVTQNQSHGLVVNRDKLVLELKAQDLHRALSNDYKVALELKAQGLHRTLSNDTES